MDRTLALIYQKLTIVVKYQELLAYIYTSKSRKGTELGGRSIVETESNCPSGTFGPQILANGTLHTKDGCGWLGRTIEHSSSGSFATIRVTLW